ncbi:hypothetical protein F511_29837 [Dorcoceras hygrometricum]|uniref:Uncharacterized protein n=1 Tax=Dorcoceras hygrometricum TaxID=472368 RepID=A0A2Z7CJF5_9LAMI|nr:hypothetical protein F511_29837 [Dorcoceras hygrometricum]
MEACPCLLHDIEMNCGASDLAEVAFYDERNRDTGPDEPLFMYYELMDLGVHGMVKWQHRGVMDPKAQQPARQSFYPASSGTPTKFLSCILWDADKVSILHLVGRRQSFYPASCGTPTKFLSCILWDADKVSILHLVGRRQSFYPASCGTPTKFLSCILWDADKVSILHLVGRRQSFYPASCGTPTKFLSCILWDADKVSILHLVGRRQSFYPASSVTPSSQPPQAPQSSNRQRFRLRGKQFKMTGSSSSGSSSG